MLICCFFNVKICLGHIKMFQIFWCCFAPPGHGMSSMTFFYLFKNYTSLTVNDYWNIVQYNLKHSADFCFFTFLSKQQVHQLLLLPVAHLCGWRGRDAEKKRRKNIKRWTGGSRGECMGGGGRVWRRMVGCQCWLYTAAAAERGSHHGSAIFGTSPSIYPGCLHTCHFSSEREKWTGGWKEKKTARFCWRKKQQKPGLDGRVSVLKGDLYLNGSKCLWIDFTWRLKKTDRASLERV